MALKTEAMLGLLRQDHKNIVETSPSLVAIQNQLPIVGAIFCDCNKVGVDVPQSCMWAM